MAAKPALNLPEVKTYGVPLILLLLAILLLVFLAIPTWASVRNLQSQVSEEEERVELLKEKSRKLLDLTDQSSLLDKQVVLFEEAVTSESKVPELLTRVQSVSDSCGLNVTALKFGGESGQEKGKVREVRLQYIAEGSFSQLSCLIKTFESASRLIDVESLRYSSNEGDGGKINLSPTATLVVYYTPEATLTPSSPVTFSFSDPKYVRAVKILEALKSP